MIVLTRLCYNLKKKYWWLGPRKWTASMYRWSDPRDRVLGQSEIMALQEVQPRINTFFDEMIRRGGEVPSVASMDDRKNWRWSLEYMHPDGRVEK